MRDPSVNAKTTAALVEASERLRAIAQIGGLDADDECDDFAIRARALYHILLDPTMPDDVRDYLLRDMCDRPRARKGGRPSTMRRDHWIVSAIRQVAHNHNL